MPRKVTDGSWAWGPYPSGPSAGQAAYEGSRLIPVTLADIHYTRARITEWAPGPYDDQDNPHDYQRVPCPICGRDFLTQYEMTSHRHRKGSKCKPQ